MKPGFSMRDKEKDLGSIFFDSLISDIDSLIFYAGIH